MTRARVFPAAALLALLPAAAPAEGFHSYAFTWQGAGGYEMRGAMAFPSPTISYTQV